jgi:hypothetical protein
MRFFTPEEDKYLLANYKKMPLKRLAVTMGRREGTARQRLHLLGYKVPQEIIEKWRKESQFQRGQTPFNKGKRQEDFLSPEGINNSKATRFKSGGLPHNTKHDGAITIRYDKGKRPYYHIRIKKAKWEYLHRHIWQTKRGQIPKDKVVVFKDGNTLNCKISNLKIITKRANMNRNSVQRYPTELRRAIQKIGALNRKINRHEKYSKRS